MKELIKAQQGEYDAALMYKALAAKVKREKDREYFMKLAEDEERHGQILQEYTGKVLVGKKKLSIIIPKLLAILGREKIYKLIAKGEYDSADKYRPFIREFPNIEIIMNDEIRHGDAVMDLLIK